MIEQLLRFDICVRRVVLVDATKKNTLPRRLGSGCDLRSPRSYDLLRTSHQSSATITTGLALPKRITPRASNGSTIERAVPV